jgi:hypothetical protein
MFTSKRKETDHIENDRDRAQGQREEKNETQKLNGKKFTPTFHDTFSALLRLRDSEEFVELGCSSTAAV